LHGGPRRLPLVSREGTAGKINTDGALERDRLYTFYRSSREKEDRMIEESTVKDRAPHDEKENDLHAHAIQKLAQELHMSAEEIRPSYMGILADLKKEAKIRVFLPVLVSRSVKAQLRQR